MEREALAIRRELYGDLNTGVAASLSDLALSLQDTDPVASDSLLTKALAIDRELLGDRHTVTMTVMNNLAGIRRDLGRYAERRAAVSRRSCACGAKCIPMSGRRPIPCTVWGGYSRRKGGRRRGSPICARPCASSKSAFRPTTRSC